MKNNSFLRTVFAILLCGFFSVSYGADWYISATGNDLTGDGSIGNPWGSFSKAQTAAASGDIIHVSGMIDMWSDPGNTGFTLITPVSPVTYSTTNKTGVIITKSLSILGTDSATDGFNGTNGTNSTRIFQILSNVTVTINKLKLANGKINSNLPSTDANINTVYGGALLITGGTITISNVNFNENQCTGKGGAIAFIPATALTVNLQNTLFDSNISKSDGGAFAYLDGLAATNNITFTNCALISNTANFTTGTVGGAGHLNNTLGSVQLSFINTTIAKNAAGGSSGGGLFLANATSTSNVVLTNCTITENSCGTAGSGGAGLRVATLFNTNAAKLKLYNCILENNIYPGSSNTTTAYTTDFGWQGDGFTVGTTLVIENTMIGRIQSANTKWTATSPYSFPTSKYIYVNNTTPVANSLVSNSYLAKLEAFEASTNSYPLGAGSLAIDYGIQSITTGVGSPFTAPTTDQIGTSRPQGPKIDAGSIEKTVIVATPPPALTADATDNTVDNTIDISYPSTPAWQAAITAISVGGTNLTATTDYVISDGTIQLKPSGLNALLTTSGTKSITIVATGYNDATVSQVINVGVPTKLTMRRQPTAPATNGARLAVQPQVNVQDQYNNNVFVTEKVSGLPTTGNWTIGGTNVKGLESGGYTNFTSMTATSATAVTGATITFTLGSLTPVISATFDIPAPVIKTWTGATDTNFNTATNWSDTTAPTSASWILIPSSGVTNFPVISSNTTVVSVTIDAAASLSVNAGNLTVSDAFVNNGTLTIENNANVIQANNVANTGTGKAIVKRNSNALKRLDFTLWSSPVTGAQTLADFSPMTSQSPNRFYSYNPINNQFAETTPTAPFVKGNGYLIRMPNTDLTTDYDAGTATLVYPGQFTGTLNNGNVSVTTATSGAYYSLGNPYPSTIDAAAFLSGNTTDGTLYFWRKTNAVANSTGSAYATWTTFGTAASTLAPNNITPNGTIQVGQGFIVKSNAGSLSFTNAMRLGTTSTQFFKTKQVTEKSRLWLNLTNTRGAFSQALVGYVDGATLGVDNGIDGKYINDSAIALTSNINNEEYTIQGRPAFDATDVVALNFKTNAAGDYSIAIDHTDGVFASGQDIYLMDSKTGIETDLKAGAYNFTADEGVDNTRFSLKYQKTLKVDSPKLNENSVTVYKNNGTLYVNSTAKAISSIKVYDIQGRLIAVQKNVKATTATIQNLKATNQVLIVKVSGEDNSEVSKKILN